ncbi:MAG: amidohydrolase [Acidobacteriaceae bacterium]
MNRIVIAAVALFLSSALSGQENAKPAADLILTNAKIWTVDRAHPNAEAVAIIGERIVAVGTGAEINQWRGAKTRVLDIHGKLVLPGFNDAHTHFMDGGFSLASIDLHETHSPQEFAQKFAAYIHDKKLQPSEWITGGGWDEQSWTNPQLPTRQMIDAVTPDNPVSVERHDGHEVLANSLALKLAGVTAQTPNPPGGEIVHDKNGEPTGILKDAAIGLVGGKIPAPTPAQRMAAVKRALAYAASLGLTSVQVMNPSYGEMAVYAELAGRGQLTARIYAAPMETGWQDQAKLGIRHAFGSSYYRMGALKGYADGSLGSTTAYFFQPYLDAPNTRGLLSDEMQDRDAIFKRLLNADKAGLQICIHAIGDQANSIVLDMFSEIEKMNPLPNAERRFRIEHAQHLAPKDFDRFAQLGVIASVQPYHAIDDGQWLEKRIGVERGKTTYAFRTLLDHGVHLAFGTDWTVAPLNPLDTIYAAVTRATLDGKHPDGWNPEQKLTVAESVQAYTMGSAYAEFQEQEKGSIAPGKLADLVVLNGDIFKIAPAELRNVKVELTMVGGKVVYRAAE